MDRLEEMDKLVVHGALYTPICKKKTMHCPRGCKTVRPNCDRLEEWINFHGYNNLHHDPSTYYIYWSDLTDHLKLKGEEIPDLEG